MAVSVAAAEAPLLTLDAAVETALAGNHRLGAADASVGEAEARLDEALAARLPRLGLDANVSRSTNPALVFSNKLGQEAFTADDFELDRLNNPDPLTNVQGLFSIYQPIYTGGATRGGIDAARAEREAAAAGRERTRQEVVRQVITAYTDAVLARSQHGVARDALETARANVVLVADLHEAGLVVESDLLQARVRESEVLELVARAESAVEVSHAAVNLALGRDLDVPFVLAESLKVAAAPDESLAALVEIAAGQRPDLLAAREHLLAAESGGRSARSGHRPEIGATGLAEANSDELFGTYGTNWSVFLGVRFSLFDGKRTQARVRQATERSTRARLELRLLEQAIDLEVRQAFYDRLSAHKRLEQTAAAVEMAGESLRIVRDRYAEGLTTLVELLETEAGLTRARSRDVAARRDLLLAQAHLDLAVGRL
jgi:outer membrane protein TolC